MNGYVLITVDGAPTPAPPTLKKSLKYGTKYPSYDPTAVSTMFSQGQAVKGLVSVLNTP